MAARRLSGFSPAVLKQQTAPGKLFGKFLSMLALTGYGWRATAMGAATMEELDGRMIACQILITGLIARVANDSKDPLRFLSDFRDEIHAVVRQVRIAGSLDTDRVRQIAVNTVDELFSLMKPPSADPAETL
jgi:hypothetical protein